MRLVGRVAVHQVGRYDPTMVISGEEFWRASVTPDGPATLHVWPSADGFDAEAFGPGREWLLRTVPDLLGQNDVVPVIEPHHDAVAKALDRHPTPTIGASHLVMHALIPAILGQRVTGLEGVQQWTRLCREFGGPAPGPKALTLPPDVAALSTVPYWALHKFGMERRRADTIRHAARHAARIEGLGYAEPAEAARVLGLVPGIGAWTIAVTVGPALGDPDAVAVGDFHLKNIVSFALAGEPRGTD